MSGSFRLRTLVPAVMFATVAAAALVYSMRTGATSRPAATRQAGATLRDCATCPAMTLIPGVDFLMGSPDGEAGRAEDEGPQRRVRVPAFAAGTHEVTWAEYGACVAAGGCPAPTDDGFGGGTRPVTNVSWDDARSYNAWLSRQAGKAYRLLSEAEWEYAARAGSSSPYAWGAEASHAFANYGMDDIEEGEEGLASGRDAWVNTAPVGSFPANAFGLHDMYGNVWEWVEDCYVNQYAAGQPSDGSAFVHGDCAQRVARGGSWSNDATALRAAYRFRDTPDYRNVRFGFRVARNVSGG